MSETLTFFILYNYIALVVSERVTTQIGESGKGQLLGYNHLKPIGLATYTLNINIVILGWIILDR